MPTFYCIITVFDKSGRPVQLVKTEHSGMIKAALALLDHITAFEIELNNYPKSQMQILEGNTVRFTHTAGQINKKLLVT